MRLVTHDTPFSPESLSQAVGTVFPSIKKALPAFLREASPLAYSSKVNNQEQAQFSSSTSG